MASPAAPVAVSVGAVAVVVNVPRYEMRCVAVRGAVMSDDVTFCGNASSASMAAGNEGRQMVNKILQCSTEYMQRVNIVFGDAKRVKLNHTDTNGIVTCGRPSLIRYAGMRRAYRIIY